MWIVKQSPGSDFILLKSPNKGMGSSLDRPFGMEQHLWEALAVPRSQQWSISWAVAQLLQQVEVPAVRVTALHPLTVKQE